MTSRRWRGGATYLCLALTAAMLGGCSPRAGGSLPVNTPAAQSVTQDAPAQNPPAPTAGVVPSSPPSSPPSPTATPQPTATVDLVRGAACLPGEWELEDVQGYFDQALRESGSRAELKQVAGGLTYRFDAEGRLQITFNEFAVTQNVPVEGGSMLTRSSLDGSAAAEYRSEDDDELVLSAFSGEGVLFVIEVDGQLLVQTALPAWASFFAALSSAAGEANQAASPPAEVRAGYSCAGDRLVLRGAGQSVDMVLVRVKN